jgi:hypothetical protein
MSTHDPSAAPKIAPPVSHFVRCPVTPDQLPEHPDFRRIIIQDSRGNAPTAADWQRLAHYMSGHPHLGLYVDTTGDSVRDLDFLAEFGWLTTLEVGCFALQSADGLRHLRHLESLDLGPTRRRVPLEVLTDLPELTNVSITDHSRELDVLGQISGLRSVGLTSAKRDDLEFLTPATQLRWVDVTLGRISDLSALARLPHLLALSLYRTKVTDLAPIGGCTSLVRLWLESLPVGVLPDLGALRDLVVLEVANLKGLDDLSPIAHAAQLRYLRVQSDTLQPDDFMRLAGHPSLEVIDANLRTSTLSYQVNQMLHLNRDATNPYYQTAFKRELAARISGEQ